ncbi:MAG TPA: class I SAM-dependent methyltransferase [Steroidobacteraceae bacterium]|nr:class I SAM-dependent methyltransferase [Steroidobacteraceae bacterium]
MNAAIETLEPVLKVDESREFRAHQAFLRAARSHMEGPLLGALAARYERTLAAREQAGEPIPTTAAEAMPLLDDCLEFQLYSWFFRHLQRFKYHRAGLGIVPTVRAQRARLEAQLESAARDAGAELRLNPDLPIPDYFRMVDFHQHTGGVATDPLDGIVYEVARRTTVPQHSDPDAIYRLVFAQLPADRTWRRVLDWGTGHGAGLITWQAMHPESECHGVDLSGPCLKLAHKRARERGFRLYFSQQDLEHLDFADGKFDLVFFNFMLHELPPARLPALLREACRVLAPGGLFAGAEFHLRPGDPFQNVIQMSHAWLNNETYAMPWYSTPIDVIAREAGFSRIEITPFERLIRSIPRSDGRMHPGTHWNLYLFGK